MKCKRCHKILDTEEYICDNCLTINNLEKHEEKVDEVVKEIGKQENPPKKNYVTCDKCGGYVELEVGRCFRCGHILNERIWELAAQKYRQAKDEENIRENTKALGLACSIVPFLGLVLWMINKKRDPVLAGCCIERWRDGLLNPFRLLVFLLLIGIVGLLI